MSLFQGLQHPDATSARAHLRRHTAGGRGAVRFRGRAGLLV